MHSVAADHFRDGDRRSEPSFAAARGQLSGGQYGTFGRQLKEVGRLNEGEARGLRAARRGWMIRNLHAGLLEDLDLVRRERPPVLRMIHVVRWRTRRATLVELKAFVDALRLEGYAVVQPFTLSRRPNTGRADSFVVRGSEHQFLTRYALLVAYRPST